MNTKAIERIKGYCCEVTQEQWEELVRVADEVGVDVGGPCSNRPIPAHFFIRYYDDYGLITTLQKIDRKQISFPDFLDKLRGNEQWQPQAGEMVEVKMDVKGDSVQCDWVEREFIGHRLGVYWAWINERPHPYDFCRPIRPTITRAEAEQQLGKRIID